MPVAECPNCSTKMKASSQLHGKQAKCPKCQEAFTVVLLNREPELLSAQSFKPCPFCCEQIVMDAKKCRYCGETVDVALRMAEEAKRENRRRNSDNLVVNNNNNNNGGGGRDNTHYYHPSPQFGHWHAVHGILTFLTFGLWFPFWIIHYMIWSTNHR